MDAEHDSRLAESHRQLADRLKQLDPQAQNSKYLNRYEEMAATVRDKLRQNPSLSQLSFDDAMALHAYTERYSGDLITSK